jgi:YihY family inner membrane protein
VNLAERTLRRFDRFQQLHSWIAIPIAVVQKFGNDRAGAFATRIAYQALFAVFPLLLVFATALGAVLRDDPELRADIIDSALHDFPIVGSELRSAAEPLEGSGIGLVVGILGSLYGALGFGHASEAAMNTVWNVPRSSWPNFFHRRVRSLAMVALIGAGAVVSALVRIVVLQAAPWGAAAFVASLAVDTLVFTMAFMVLTAAPLTWRDVRLGALLAGLLWGALKLLGEWYVGHVLRGATDVYGFFATVIALLTWVFVAAQLVLLSAEVNVVVRDRLWPRSMTQPPLTRADREVFCRLARTTARRPEYDVQVHFGAAADHDPLESD